MVRVFYFWESVGAMKNEEMVLTLCYQCKEIMRKSGRKLKRTANDIKEPCSICKRFGFEYKIKSGGEGGK